MDAYIGLGSNMGDRVGNLGEALQRVQEPPHTHVAAVSHAYESEPWGVSGQPAFANAVARLETTLEADMLLAVLHDVEEAMGRERRERFGPRVIDLDILLFGDEEWRSDALTIPHPRLTERDFVVTPLLEIAPGIALPDGTPILEQAAIQGRVTADLGAIPGWEAFTPGESGEQDAEEPGDDAEWRGDPDAGEPPSIPEHPITPEDIRLSRDSRSPVEGWLPVGEERYEGNLVVTQADFSLVFDEAVLNDAGIPSVFYPHRPGEGTLPWPYAVIDRPVRLYVPATLAEKAERILAEAESSRPEPYEPDRDE
jgi:2-amino-4-hydroxy-6-hydroxymethyldihydropteridine diphosphokinase